MADEMNNAIKATSWEPLVKTIQNSKMLLDATIAGNEQVVAKATDTARDENTSILKWRFLRFSPRKFLFLREETKKWLVTFIVFL